MTIASALCQKYERRRRGQKPSMLVMHYTNLPLADAFRVLTTSQRKVSAHYLIERNGCVHYLVDERHAAWHAGHSWWMNEHSLNHASIGIELDYQPQLRARGWYFPAFPPAQIASLTKLSRAIMTRHRISAARVLGHSDIAPDRKMDPGNAFPWQRLAKAGIGVWPRAPRRRGLTPLARAQKGDAVRRLQEGLRALGYGISAPREGQARALSVDGHYGRRTAQLVQAFQRHFRARRVDGMADAETQSLVFALLRQA